MYLPLKYQTALDRKYLFGWLKEVYPIPKVEEPVSIEQKWIQLTLLDFVNLILTLEKRERIEFSSVVEVLRMLVRLWSERRIYHKNVNCEKIPNNPEFERSSISLLWEFVLIFEHKQTK